MQEGKVVVCGGLTNSWEKMKSERQKRRGKTRDLFKKIRDTKGTYYAKMGTIKD